MGRSTRGERKKGECWIGKGAYVPVDLALAQEHPGDLSTITR